MMKHNQTSYIHIYSYDNFYSVGSTILVTEHFRELQLLLWDACSEYENFGHALNLSPTDVTAIKKTHQLDTNECFNAVLTEVLKRGVTQEDLVKVLKSTTLQYVQLAEKLQNKTFYSSKPHVVYGHVHEQHQFPAKKPPLVHVHMMLVWH